MERFLTFRLETKMPWRQTPSCKKKAIEFSTVIMSAYQDQLNAGFSKVCEIFKVCGIKSLKKNVQEFYTPVCYCRDNFTPLNMTWHKTKRDWLLYLSVIWPLGRAKAAKVPRPSAVSLKVWLRETMAINTAKNRATFMVPNPGKTKLKFTWLAS